MSNPHMATLGSPVSSAKRRACSAREGISCTPTSAYATTSPSGEAALADAPLRLLSQRVINAEVVRGMEKNWQQWLDMISRHVPAFLHGFARDVSGLQGSRVYRAVESEDISYRIYSFAKD